MDYDAIVVGAGVVGLAVARQIAKANKSVLVLEQHALPGTEISARNSEVIHAGIYYPTGSLKAKLCVKGRELLYAYCAKNQVTYQKTGKLIVATEPAQLHTLEKILAQGRKNGVDDLRAVDLCSISEMEPELDVLGGLYSPSTGIIDVHGLILSLQGELEANGGMLCCNSPVVALSSPEKGRFKVGVGGKDPTTVSCGILVNCAGHNARVISQKLLGNLSDKIPPAYYSKGTYFSVSRKLPFSHLIYPVPGDEGLGIHLTLDLAGYSRFGPDTQWVENLDYQIDAKRAESFYQAIRSYFPGLRDGELTPAYTGIRPKITGPGEAAGDFRIENERSHGIRNYISLHGIESPGLTSCLAIAEEVSLALGLYGALAVDNKIIGSQI